MVYLIHLEKPYKHARHYVGYADSMESFERRIQHHKNNTGARFMQVVNAAGIKWDVKRIWPDGDRAQERRIKNGRSTCYCPICKVERNRKRRERHKRGINDNQSPAGA